jgi:hypothetical protein
VNELGYFSRGGLWAKHMGLKQGAIGNTLGEPIGNLNETKEKWKKNILSSRPHSPTQNLKENKIKAL